jgi:hypothetical protein
MIATAASDIDLLQMPAIERRVPRLQIFAAFAVVFGIPALCIAGGQAGILHFVFPSLCLAIGAFLLWRWKPAYVEFVFWLWFISPFIGRMADFQGGWTPNNAVELAPYITTGLCAIPLLASLRIFGTRRALPYVCALVAIFYGLILGLIGLPLFDVLRAFLNWIVPVFFGLFIYQNRREYPEFKRAIERSFLIGMLLTGIYGLYQFFTLPDWDRLWMLNVEVKAFGVIEPLKLRIFSTMNAPTIYAAVSFCGLLLLFNMKGKLRLISAAVGFIGLMLTMSRASWLSMVAGGIFLMIYAGMRQRIRLAVAVFACSIFLAGIWQVPVVHDLLLKRLDSFSDPNQDVSFGARVAGHEVAFNELALEPYGEGIGSAEANHNTEGNDELIGPHDSSILEILYSLGWMGTLIYLLGLASLVFQAIRAGNDDSLVISSKAILVGFAAQFLLNSVLIGILGFMVWTFASMSMAAADRAKELAQDEIEQGSCAANCAAA